MKLLLPAVFLLLPLAVSAQIDVAPPDGPGCPPACVPPPTVVTARAVTASTPWNTPLWIQFLGATTGAGPLTYATSSSPFHGSLGTITADTVLYTPTLRYTGMDEFSYRAADQTFTSGVASVSIEVTDPIDTSAPSFSAPLDQTFATTTFPAQPALVPPSISDDIDADPQLTYAPLLFPLGTTTVTWTATDASGNSAVTTSLVVITDSTPVEPEPAPVAAETEPAPSPGPIGNGPPVDYLPAPANPPPPTVPSESPLPMTGTQSTQTPVSEPATQPTPDPVIPTSVATQSPDRSASTSLARANSQAQRTLSTTARPQETATKTAQVAAAGAAVSISPKAYDYAGLFILLLLVLIAALYEWRRERRSAESDL